MRTKAIPFWTPFWTLQRCGRCCISSGNLGVGCGESDADFSRLTRLLLDGNLVIASDGRQKRKQGGRCLEVHRWTRITINRVVDWPGWPLPGPGLFVRRAAVSDPEYLSNKELQISPAAQGSFLSPTAAAAIAGEPLHSSGPTALPDPLLRREAGQRNMAIWTGSMGIASGGAVWGPRRTVVGRWALSNVSSPLPPFWGAFLRGGAL
jgi:hypothetical protein